MTNYSSDIQAEYQAPKNKVQGKNVFFSSKWHAEMIVIPTISIVLMLNLINCRCLKLLEQLEYWYTIRVHVAYLLSAFSLNLLHRKGDEKESLCTKEIEPPYALAAVQWKKRCCQQVQKSRVHNIAGFSFIANMQQRRIRLFSWKTQVQMEVIVG